MNWLKLIQLIIGTAESIVPIFIHNPKSQQIEAAIITTVNAVDEVAAQLGPPTATPTPVTVKPAA